MKTVNKLEKIRFERRIQGIAIDLLSGGDKAYRERAVKRFSEILPEIMDAFDDRDREDEEMCEKSLRNASFKHSQHLQSKMYNQ